MPLSRAWRAALRAPLALALLAPLAAAPASDDAALAKVREALRKQLPEVQPEDVRPSEAPGIYEVQRGTAFGYVTADGKYLLRGDLIELSTGTVLTEARRRTARADVVKKLGAKAIEFAPPADFIEHTIYVYVDVDCNYCRQLHKEVPQMNAKGIAVRYLFYPRFGPKSDAFRRAQSVYCSAEPAKAVSQYFAGGSIKDAKNDCDNPVAEQYQAAVAMGIKGTPMIILPDGSTMYGYVGAEGMAQTLAELEPAKKKE